MKTINYAILIVLVFAAAGDCENYKYESHGRRDPFVPLIGFEKPAVTKLEDVTSAEDIVLEGIAAAAKGKKMAIINGHILKENDRVGMVEVKKITDNAVTLVIDGQTYDIKLPEKGGGKKSDR